jgi:hypothetical protein
MTSYNGFILQRSNPFDPNNALKFTNLSGLCCGDKAAATICRYTATISGIISTTVVNQVNIGGVTHDLDGDYLVNQERERDALIANIERVVNGLGYDGTGNITHTFAAGVLTVSTDYSDLEFGWLESTANPFIPTVCQVIGDIGTSACDAGASIVVVAETLVVKPYSTGTITNVNINDGGGAVYNGDLTNGVTGNATVTTDATGQKVITVNGAAGGENWTGSVTFVVTITTSGCPTTFTRTIILVYP